MGYECSNLTEESLLGCSNKSSDDAAGERKQEVYGEDFDEPKMKLGKRRVLARRGWVGEKVSLFSILLTREDPFKVIPKRKDHDAH
jgi:hypothetical protein